MSRTLWGGVSHILEVGSKKLPGMNIMPALHIHADWVTKLYMLAESTSLSFISSSMDSALKFVDMEKRKVKGALLRKKFDLEQRKTNVDRQAENATEYPKQARGRQAGSDDDQIQHTGCADLARCVEGGHGIILRDVRIGFGRGVRHRVVYGNLLKLHPYHAIMYGLEKPDVIECTCM